jgi:hypothetical protein
VARLPVAQELRPGGVIVLNSSAAGIASLEGEISPHVRQQLADHRARLFWIDTDSVAASAGVSAMFVLEAAFVHLSDVSGAVALLKRHGNAGHADRAIMRYGNYLFGNRRPSG